MQMLIVLLASHDEDALHLGVCGPFRMSVIADVVDHALPNLIQILFDAILFLATDALHDKVFLTVDYDQGQKPLLPIDLYPEVSADMVEEVDSCAEGVARGVFSLGPDLHAHDIREVNLFDVQDFAGCYAFKLALGRGFQHYVADALVPSVINFVEIRLELLAFMKALFEGLVAKNGDFVRPEDRKVPIVLVEDDPLHELEAALRLTHFKFGNDEGGVVVFDVLL